jgi:5-methylcytosine-specific restriction enzyme subunit McrC|tara:strand:- start:1445 stop:2752 length:1308 start_codon:yes stop_codon:yes gene_type:complete
MNKENHRQATITEYGAVGREKMPKQDKFLCDRVSDKAFNALKKFNAENDDAIFTLTSISAEDGSRVDALIAKSFVGVIETNCGSVVEILPKIYVHDRHGEKDRIREIFLKMLRFLRDSPFKEIDLAHLHTTKHPILEIFISLFLADLTKLVQKGIARDYVNIEENQPFLKGKMLFNQNIKYNITHKERFHVSFDEFIANRSENRLIKSTLEFLSKRVRSSNNQKRIREFTFTFDEIPSSKDVDTDFSKLKPNHLTNYYDKVMKWCSVFLKKESFTNFKGKAVSLALLFPMERVFENYVGTMFKRSYHYLPVYLQDKKQSLIEKHDGGRKFALKPDIVAIADGRPIILDTKWKLINQNKPKKNYWISQADMYQMFAYGEKYKSEKLYLLYPKNEEFDSKLKEFNYYQDDKQMTLNVYPLDLEKISRNKKLSLNEIQ